MGIIDKLSSLLPARGARAQTPARPDPRTLRVDLDRWLSDLVQPSWGLPRATDVRETDDAVVVTADLPGLDPDDVTLELLPDALVIRGQTREAREDTRDDVYVAARREGAFVWTVPLPEGVDLDRAAAEVKHGVLTVTFPKVTAGRAGRRIPITAA